MFNIFNVGLYTLTLNMLYVNYSLDISFALRINSILIVGKHMDKFYTTILHQKVHFKKLIYEFKSIELYLDDCLQDCFRKFFRPNI